MSVTLGTTVLIDTDRPFSIFVSVGLIKYPQTLLEPRYLTLVMNSPLLMSQYDKIKAGGSHTNKLNLTAMPSFLIPLPPLPEQRRIVAKVDALMSLCDELESRQAERVKLRDRASRSCLASLTESRSRRDLKSAWQRLSDRFEVLYDAPKTIDQLRQSILQLAVQGKLVPQDPDDEPADRLFDRISKVQGQLTAANKIRRSKPWTPIDENPIPFEIPRAWRWVQIGRSRSDPITGLRRRHPRTLSEYLFCE